MPRSFWIWVCWFLFLLMVDFLVPFTLLADVPRISGSFLFWLIWIGIVIISMFVLFLRWQDDHSPD